MQAKIGSLEREETTQLLGVAWYHRRHIVLDRAALYCFAKAPSNQKIQSVLNVANGVMMQRVAGEHAICLTDVSARTAFKLTADSPEDCADWARALELATGGEEAKVLKMGYLHRQLLGRRGASRRTWCVLDHSVFYTFDGPPDFSPMAVLPLAKPLNVTVADPDTNGRAAFTLEVGNTPSRMVGTGEPLQRTWSLRAETEEQRTEWLDAIQDALMSIPDLDPEDVDAPKERSGWLQKLNGGIGDTGWMATFNPRYVVLACGILVYYARPSDATARGRLNLVDSNLLAANLNYPSPESPLEFSITAASGQPSYRFRADTAAHALIWCEWIREAIERVLTAAACHTSPSQHRALPRKQAQPGPAATTFSSPAGAHKPETLQTISIYTPVATESTCGDGISSASFDQDSDPADNGCGMAPTSCACGAPQAARWQCNARLVKSFHVVWRRIPLGLSEDGALHGALQGTVVHTETVGVTPNEAVDNANEILPLMAECYSAYLPTVDDIGCQLEVEYTPMQADTLPVGTPGSMLHNDRWKGIKCSSNCTVQPNETVLTQGAAALKRGSAEFLVVCQLLLNGQLEDLWCELQISPEGMRVRSLRGAKALFTLARHSGGSKHLNFPSDGSPIAEVVLPSEALQACLHGAHQATLVVQAESAYLRDAIVWAARKFAAAHTHR